MEQDHVKDSDGDGRVGDIKDGTEKDEMPILAEEKVRKPAVVLTGDVDNREIKHIDDFAVEPAGIMEDLAVEDAVDNVAQRSRGDEGESEKHSEFGPFFREAEQQKYQDNNGHDSEDAECGLDNATAPHPAESHAGVLYEKQIEPAADDRDLLSDGHMSLDPDFQHLIQDQDESNNQK